MKVNTDKFDLFLSKNDEIQIEVSDLLIENSPSGKRLAVIVTAKSILINTFKNIL